MIKGCRISTRPTEEDYIATVGKKKFLCHTIRGCFKAANGRWPKDLEEVSQFIELSVQGKRRT